MENERVRLPNVIEMWTDGSQKSSDKVGGWGTFLKCGYLEKELFGGERDTTNNRMEMMAVIKGLEQINHELKKKVEVYSDSAYLVNAMNQGWIDNWQSNGWLTSKKESVENQDLWERIVELVELHSQGFGGGVTFFKVRGHLGIEYNELADKLANKGVDMVRSDINE